MKRILVVLEDLEFKVAKKNKGSKTWKEIVMGEKIK